MWYANIIAGVVVFLLGVATTVLAWLTLPYTGDFGPGPGFVPFWLGITLMGCSVPVIITDLRIKERSERLFRPETAKCLRVLILVVAVFLSLPILGFSAGLALITAGGMRLMGKHRLGFLWGDRARDGHRYPLPLRSVAQYPVTERHDRLVEEDDGEMPHGPAA